MTSSWRTRCRVYPRHPLLMTSQTTKARELGGSMFGFIGFVLGTFGFGLVTSGSVLYFLQG